MEIFPRAHLDVQDNAREVPHEYHRVIVLLLEGCPNAQLLIVRGRAKRQQCIALIDDMKVREAKVT